MALRIYFLRHGRPENNECLRGTTDFPLTPEGFEQMQKSFAHIEDDLTQIISSPLSRCATFSQYIADKNNIPLNINPDWQEIHFGDWDGQDRQHLQKQYPKEMMNYWKNPWENTPPNGESLDHFQKRLDKAFDQLLQNYEEKNILIVTHSAVIRLMLMRFLNIAPRSNSIFSGLHLPYATLITVDIFKVGNEYKSFFLWPNTAF